MMILATFRLCALGALLAGTAVPSLAAAPEVPTTHPNAQGNQRADAGRSRRVELPFPLDIRTPERDSRPPAVRQDEGPHPFRETLLKRASLTTERETPVRLSRAPDFS